MSFTITCNKCRREMLIVNEGNYSTAEIDLLPEEERDYNGYLESRKLSLFCNNPSCGNSIEVEC